MGSTGGITVARSNFWFTPHNIAGPYFWEIFFKKVGIPSGPAISSKGPIAAGRVSPKKFSPATISSIVFPSFNFFNLLSFVLAASPNKKSATFKPILGKVCICSVIFSIKVSSVLSSISANVGIESWNFVSPTVLNILDNPVVARISVCCLAFLWNSALASGLFSKSWKLSPCINLFFAGSSPTGLWRISSILARISTIIVF